MSTVLTTTSSGPYSASAQTTFAVTFQSASADGIAVYKDGVLATPGTYIFNRDDDGTGDVVFSSPQTGQILIVSNPNFQEQAEFNRYGAFYPDQLNPVIDRFARKDIYLKDQIDGVGSDITSLQSDILDLQTNFAVATGTIVVLTDVSQIASRTGMVTGDMIRVINYRNSGWWQFDSTPATALVTSDPYGGLYRAPASAPTGSAGVWKRIVADSYYHAEWWLPSVMPNTANLNLNSMVSLVPAGSTIILPARQTVLSAPWIIRTSGYTIRGRGRQAPLYGVGGALNNSLVLIAADDTTFENVWGGGTYGTQPGGAESPVFHVYDANEQTGGTGYHKVKNVKFLDCGAFDAMVGLRLGYSTDGNGDATGITSIVYESEDCVVENFHAINMWLMGIECFNSRRARIKGFNIQMGTPYLGGGQYGMRINAAEDAIIESGYLIGSSEAASGMTGIIVDIAGIGSQRYDMGRDLILRNINMENVYYGFLVTPHDGMLLIEGCNFSGRSDATTVFLFCQVAGLTWTEQNHISNLRVINNVVHNASAFAYIGGDIANAEILDNHFISNDNAGARFILCYGFSGENFQMQVRRNRALPKQNATVPIAFTNVFDASCVAEIDDNDIIPNTAGQIYTTYGPSVAVTIKTRNDRSNRTIASSRWALERPALDLASFSSS